MSYHQKVSLERQAAVQLGIVCSAQHELIGVLRRQLAEESQETESFRDEARNMTSLYERIYERLDGISKANALGKFKTPMEILDRIASRLRSYVETEELVKLCLKGERPDGLVYTPEAEAAICAEVDRLKAEEMPF